MNEKRIYIVVPKKITTPLGAKFDVSCGYASAQAVHAGSLLKLSMVQWKLWTLKQAMKPITTITLQCRDHKELQHVLDLATNAGVNSVDFFDENEEVYGKGVHVLTTHAFGPMTKEEAEPIFGYLPRWDCD